MLPVLNNKTSNVALLAVSLEDAARQCRLTTDDLTDENIKASLTNAIYAAQSYLENKYTVSFGENKFKAVYEIEDQTIKRLHFIISKLSKVDKITFDSVEIEKPYKLCTSNTHSYIEYASSIPTQTTVEVSYTAGFKNPEDVPYNIEQAILMLTAHYFDIRNPESHNQINISHYAVEALMRPYQKALI